MKFSINAVNAITIGADVTVYEIPDRYGYLEDPDTAYYHSVKKHWHAILAGSAAYREKGQIILGYYAHPARIIHLDASRQETLRGGASALFLSYTELDDLDKFEAECISDVAPSLLEYWLNPARIIHLDASRQAVIRGGLNALMTSCPKTEDLAKFEAACTSDVASVLLKHWKDPSRIFRLVPCRQDILRGGLEALMAACPEMGDLYALDVACKSDELASLVITDSMIKELQRRVNPFEVTRGSVKKGIDSVANRKARFEAIASSRKFSRADLVKVIRGGAKPNTANVVHEVHVPQSFAGVKHGATWSPPGHQKLKKSKFNPTSVIAEPNNEISLPIKEDQPIVPVDCVTMPDVVEEYADGVDFDANDDPLDFGAGNDDIEESVTAIEPALNIDQAFFADIDETDDAEAASKRMVFDASKMEGAIEKVKSSSMMNEARQFSECLRRKRPLLPIAEEPEIETIVVLPQAIDEANDVVFEANDEPANFGAGNDEVEEPVVADEPAINVGQDLFAGIDADDEVVASSRTLREIECSLDGVYWAPVSGKRVRNAPVRF